MSICGVTTPHTAETRETKRNGGGGRDEEERSADVIRLSAKAGKERGKAKKDADPKAEEELPRATIHDDVDDGLDHIRRDHSQGTNRTRKQSPLLLFMPNLNPLQTAEF